MKSFSISQTCEPFQVKFNQIQEDLKTLAARDDLLTGTYISGHCCVHVDKTLFICCFTTYQSFFFWIVYGSSNVGTKFDVSEHQKIIIVSHQHLQGAFTVDLCDTFLQLRS